MTGRGQQPAVPAADARRRRRAVLEHAVAERRRTFSPLLHVGEPGGVQTVMVADDADLGCHALRVEALEAMLRRVGALGEDGGEAVAADPLVWLTRHGELDREDVDAAWLAATDAAAGELDLALTLVVVNRHRWLEPRTGAGRAWRRLRLRS